MYAFFPTTGESAWLSISVLEVSHPPDSNAAMIERTHRSDISPVGLEPEGRLS